MISIADMRKGRTMNDLIEKLSNLRSQFNCFNENERDEYNTLSEAIKVLSERPELCEDAVSRQAVADVAYEVGNLFDGEDDTRTPYGVAFDIQMAVDKLPSVTPKRNTGKWIDRGYMKVGFYCSECGGYVVSGKENFCPNCGSFNGDARNE